MSGQLVGELATNIKLLVPSGGEVLMRLVDRSVLATNINILVPKGRMVKWKSRKR